MGLVRLLKPANVALAFIWVWSGDMEFFIMADVLFMAEYRARVARRERLGREAELLIASVFQWTCGECGGEEFHCWSDGSNRCVGCGSCASQSEMWE